MATASEVRRFRQLANPELLDLGRPDMEDVGGKFPDAPLEDRDWQRMSAVVAEEPDQFNLDDLPEADDDWRRSPRNSPRNSPRRSRTSSLCGAFASASAFPRLKTFPRFPLSGTPRNHQSPNRD